MRAAQRIVAVSLVWMFSLGAAGGRVESALQLMLGGAEVTGVWRIDVFRTNPWLGTVIAARPSGIENSYVDRATVTRLDFKGLTAIMQALRDSTVGNGCPVAGYTYDTFPVSWGVRLLTMDNHELGSIYLVENGLCAATNGKVVGIDPTLVIFLRRYFAFMSFARGSDS